MIAYLIVALVMFASLLLQTTLLAGIHPKPDGVLASVLAIAFLQGPLDGAVAGFLGGIAEDALSGASRGGFCLTFLFAGWVLGFVFQRFNSSNMLVLLISGISGSMLQFFLFKLFASLAGIVSVPFSLQASLIWFVAEGFLCVVFLFLFKKRFRSEAIRL